MRRGSVEADYEPGVLGRRAGTVLALCAFVAGACVESRPAASAGDQGSPEGALVYGRGPDDARDLYVVPVAGGTPRQLTSHPANDGLPRWSADGRSVVFTSERSGNWQLWRVPAEGGEPTAIRVNVNEHTEWQADESPDGRHLAFLHGAGA